MGGESDGCRAVRVSELWGCIMEVSATPSALYDEIFVNIETKEQVWTVHVVQLAGSPEIKTAICHHKPSGRYGAVQDLPERISRIALNHEDYTEGER